MPATIVRTEFTNWTALPEWYDRIAAELPDSWIVNAGGEVVDRDPLEIAEHVVGGGVWVDYCGYPMWYREEVLADPFSPTGFTISVSRQGTMGFSRFLMRMNMLFDHTFLTDESRFKYPRSLVVRTKTVPKFIVPNRNAPHIENDLKIYSCFRLDHPSGGKYFYAYSEVSPDIYLPFLKGIEIPKPPPVPVPIPIPPIPIETIWWIIPLTMLAASGGLAIYSTMRRR